MNISIEMLKEMVRDIGGPELTDEVLEGVLTHVRSHEAQGKKLRQLDLSKVLPVRVMRIDTGAVQS